MIMGVERKWAPTMMKLDAEKNIVTEEPDDGKAGNGSSSVQSSGGGAHSGTLSAAANTHGTQHFFLEILRTKHGVWHMWVWYLGEPDEAGAYRCEIAIR